MARSYDSRKTPGGPVYDEKGNRALRGPKRLAAVGRLLPGDHVEVVREIERLWAWVYDIRRMISKHRSDIDTVQDQIEVVREYDIPDIDWPVVDQYGVDLTPGYQHFNGTFSSAGTQPSVADSPLTAIPKAHNNYLAGFRLLVRWFDADLGSVDALDAFAQHSATPNSSPAHLVPGAAFPLPPWTGGGFSGGPITTPWVDSGFDFTATHAIDEDAYLDVRASTNLGLSSGSAEGYLFWKWVPASQVDDETVADYPMTSGDEGDVPVWDDTTSSWVPTPKGDLITLADVDVDIQQVSADTTLTAASSFVEVDATAAARTITLPSAATVGKHIIIVKKMDSTSNNVVVQRSTAPQTIDGSVSITLTRQYETVILVSSTTGTALWRVLGRYFGGTLPITGGGTGQTTAQDAFDALSPLTTDGDLLAYEGGNAIRVPIGTDGHILYVDYAQPGKIKWAASPGFPDWADVTGKPLVFPPDTHTHVAADIDSEASTTGQVLTSDGVGGASWEDPTGGGGGGSGTPRFIATWFGNQPPLGTGPAGGVWRVPEVGGLSTIFDIDRLSFRMETAPGQSALSYTIVVEKSPGGGAFTPTTVGTLTLAAGDNSETTTTGLGQVTSGELLRVKWTAIGVLGTDFSIQLEGTEAP